MNRNRAFPASVTSLACILCMGAVYVRYVLGGDDAYGGWVNFLTEHPAGILLFTALPFSLVWGGALSARSALRPPACSPGYIRSLDISAAFRVADGIWAGPLSRWLKQKGFHLKAEPFSGYALKGRWAFLPGTILRVGLVLFLVGFWLSHHGRKVDDVLIRHGATVTLDRAPLILAKIEPGLPATHLQVGRERGFRVRGAKVWFEGHDGPLTVLQGWPVKSGGRNYALAALGYTQTFYRTIPEDGTGTETLDLDVLPPGKEDPVNLFGEEARISLAPEKTLKKGRLTGELYNLEEPSYRVKAPGGEFRVVPAGSQGAAIIETKVAEGPRDFWVRIRVVQDPGLGLLIWSLPVTGLGSILVLCNLFWYRREVVCVYQDGELILGYGEQYFKKWGIQRFYRWKDEISAILSVLPAGDRV